MTKARSVARILGRVRFLPKIARDISTSVRIAGIPRKVVVLLDEAQGPEALRPPAGDYLWSHSVIVVRLKPDDTCPRILHAIYETARKQEGEDYGEVVVCAWVDGELDEETSRLALQVGSDVVGYLREPWSGQLLPVARKFARRGKRLWLDLYLTPGADSISVDVNVPLA